MGALDLTLQAFANHATYTFYLRDLEAKIDYPPDDTTQDIVNILDVLYEDELSTSMIEYIENQTTFYSSSLNYDIDSEDVKEYCVLYFTLTIFIDGDAEIYYELIPCIKVNSSWYLLMYTY